ncbi:hypothetical protein GGX14DRAFT_386181 [Mycena pura]|uniref:Uncharacterized protein n=1 Tax=Mycena pura TaxID=153505 RepID=A0AAD6YNR3_9AGAR|nr:hypothetical protein GGX14DRAFT_386181 [Mycena pura]
MATKIKTLLGTGGRHEERQLGETEVSYFLPSRESGVNDMYEFTLALGYYLLSRSEMPSLGLPRSTWYHETQPRLFGLDYYPPPPSSACLKELIDSYLNGPRTLSNERLSYLIVSQQPTAGESQTTETADPVPQNFALLLCATHFIGGFIEIYTKTILTDARLGDGMALHQLANDFFNLLGSERAEESLQTMLAEEWYSRWGTTKLKDDVSCLPSSLEDRLPPVEGGRFRHAASRVVFENSQAKLIGGQNFPRRSGSSTKTVVTTVSLDPERTKLILKKCKTQNVSISAALFAVVNLAWAKTCDLNWELPMMMYSAVNLRPILTASKTSNASYCFPAIGYFHVILPTFIPKSGSKQDIEKTFWHRARAAKKQSTRAAKHPMLVSQTLEMARERGQRARGWAREDDEKARGTWKAPPPLPTSKLTASKSPSTALIGLTLMGDLDGVYKHSAFPRIELHTLTAGTRQRAGGILLFVYTFSGQSI